MDKSLAYKKLCEKAQKQYDEKEFVDDVSKTELFWVPECEEINLWTYWQGRGNWNPKILLVGQDWGCGYNDIGMRFRKNAAHINNGESVSYFDGIKGFVTDENLAELFSALGYKDIKHCRYEDLFFTNIVLGYRNDRTSGALDTKYLERDQSVFRELVHLLEPQIIMCLGKLTYESVMKALGNPKKVKGNYNDYIRQSLENPEEYKAENGRTAYVYALAHPGALGTMNRGRGVGNGKSGLELQKADWKKIKETLTELS